MSNLNETANVNGNVSRNAELKEASEALEYYDNILSFTGLNTLQLMEGLISAFIFGFAIVKLQKILKFSEITTNVIAYLSAWYSQHLFMSKAKEIDLFKKRTENVKFIEKEGSEYLQDMYYQQNTVHNSPPDDIYHIVKE